MTLPEKTESTMVGSMEACAKAAVVATAPSSVAEKPLKEPPKLPISFCIEAERSLSSESFFSLPRCGSEFNKSSWSSSSELKLALDDRPWEISTLSIDSERLKPKNAIQ